MKRILILLLTLLLAAPCFADEARPLSIVATNFPCYDFARTIAGDSARITMLLPPGSESHSYEPTPQDIIAIQNADLFLYVGGESDTWVEGILESMGASAPKTLTLSSCVELLEEEQSASMQPEAGGEDEEEAEMDEHVWTSPVNAMKIAQVLCDELSGIAPMYAEGFRANLQAFLEEASALDAEFRQIVAEGKRNVLIFGDRFPFRYFVAEYGLRYDAAFPGCSEDSEPSVRTVISLIDRVREEEIPVVFYIEFSSHRTADILAEETGAAERLFHSCHNVSAQDIESGVTWLSLMRQNAAALQEALN